MGVLKPSEIQDVKYFALDGMVNGEKYSEAIFNSPNEAWDAYHQPVYSALNTDKFSETVGGYASRNEKEHTEEFREIKEDWLDNQSADFYFVAEDSNGENIRIDLIGRNDRSLSKVLNPFSIMEGKHDPSKHDSAYKETKRIGLRMAHRYIRDFYDERDFFGHSSLVDESMSEEDLPKGILVPEVDFITAYDREGGLEDQTRQSSLPFTRLIRKDYRILQDGFETEFEGSSEAVPYLYEWLGNDLKSAGISEEEARLSGRHIGTANALGAVMEFDREEAEIMQDSDETGDFVVNIDPEIVEYTTSDARISQDFEKFRQQFANLAGQHLWREREPEMVEERNDIVKRANQSSKNWRQVLLEEIPENWEEEMPEEKIISTV